MSEETGSGLSSAAASPGPGRPLVLDLESADGGELPPSKRGPVDLHLGEGLVRQYSLCGDPADRQVYRLEASTEGSIPAAAPSPPASASAKHRGRHRPAAQPCFRWRPAQAYLGDPGGRRHRRNPRESPWRALHAAGKPFPSCTCGRSQASYCPSYHSTRRWPRRLCRFRAYPLRRCRRSDAQRLDLKAVLAGATAPPYYVCGPSGFMGDRRIRPAAVASPAQIHKEYFKVEQPSGGKAFDVLLKRSPARRYMWPATRPSTTPWRHRREDQGVHCEQGVCGTCLYNVLEARSPGRLPGRLRRPTTTRSSCAAPASSATPGAGSLA